MKKKMLSTLLCLTMAAGVMTGCGGRSKDSGLQTASNQQATDGQAASNDQVSNQASSDRQSSSTSAEQVVIWDYFETDAQKKMMQDLIDGQVSFGVSTLHRFLSYNRIINTASCRKMFFTKYQLLL